MSQENDPDRTRGLYRKYVVYRTAPSGAGPLTEVTEPCFVLRYLTDPHARAALAAYADSCEQDYPNLATDLRHALER
jgi:hypothetical protein